MTGMSLVKLLTEFPNYSARRVRRLAAQIAYLEGIKSREAKGIADDLMEYNLLQAKTESQLNDDVRVEAPNLADSNVAGWWGKIDSKPETLEDAIDEINEMRDDWAKVAMLLGFETFTDPEVIFERLEKMKPKANRMSETFRVCKVSEAIRAIDLLATEGNAYPDVVKSARGIVHGDSFMAEREYMTVEEGVKA